MIAQLTDNLFLSGENEAHNVDKLKEFGITAIVNVGYEVTSPNHKDFLMIKIGLKEFQPNPEIAKHLIIITLRSLIHNGHKVLIHCHAGAHRSPFIAFSYLADIQLKTLDDVYQEFMPKVPWGIIYPNAINFI